jgi:hypothetical protein
MKFLPDSGAIALSYGPRPFEDYSEQAARGEGFQRQES